MCRRSLLLLLLLVPATSAQDQAPNPPGSRSTGSSRPTSFRGKRFAGVKWLEHGAYTTLQPSKAHKSASDIVRFDAAGKSEALVPAEKLVPPNAKEPLVVQGYELSKESQPRADLHPIR